jgi:hypothetical protein
MDKPVFSGSPFLEGLYPKKSSRGLRPQTVSDPAIAPSAIASIVMKIRLMKLHL